MSNKIKTRLEPMPLSQLLKMRHPKNPKDHNIPDLVASFKRFGFKAFPTIDEATQVLVAGHGRCEALEHMRSLGVPPPDGVEEKGTEWLVPVIRGMSFANEHERDAFLIADNQHVAAGGWKFEELSNLVRDLEAANVGFDGLGFGQTELDSLLGNYVPPQLPPDEPPPATDNAPTQVDNKPSVRNEIDVKTSYCCPKCGHEWQQER